MKKLYQKIVDSKYFTVGAALASVCIAACWFYFVKKYSVNLLFSDAWDFHRVFIWDYTLLKQFHFQFGPHRMGIGLVITGWLNALSGWNSNWISIVIAFLIFLSFLVYLFVKYRLFRNINFFDVVIPVIVLSFTQYEVLNITPFLSYSGVPAILVSLICLTLFVKSRLLRNILLLFLNLNLVWSAFGFFMGLVTIMLFASETIIDFTCGRKKSGFIGFVSFLIAVFTLVLFFKGYKTDYASVHILILWSKPWQYLQYISHSYAGFFGFKHIGMLPFVFGFMVFSVVVFVLIKSLIGIYSRTNQDEKQVLMSKMSFILVAYSLLFVVNLAFGRLRLGFEFAGSSRYMVYLVPSIIGVYFYLNSLSLPKKSLLIPVFFIFIIFMQLSSVKSVKDMEAWYAMKSNWKYNYLKYEDADKADSVCHFRVHPNNASIQDVLDYLKKHELNLYHTADKQDNFPGKN